VYGFQLGLVFFDFISCLSRFSLLFSLDNVNLRYTVHSDMLSEEMKVILMISIVKEWNGMELSLSNLFTFSKYSR